MWCSNGLHCMSFSRGTNGTPLRNTDRGSKVQELDLHRGRPRWCRIASAVESFSQCSRRHEVQGMTKQRFSIAADFSQFPAGRTKEDGPDSGERLREMLIE